MALVRHLSRYAACAQQHTQESNQPDSCSGKPTVGTKSDLLLGGGEERVKGRLERVGTQRAKHRRHGRRPVCTRTTRNTKITKYVVDETGWQRSRSGAPACGSVLTTKPSMHSRTRRSTAPLMSADPPATRQGKTHMSEKILARSWILTSARGGNVQVQPQQTQRGNEHRHRHVRLLESAGTNSAVIGPVVCMGVSFVSACVPVAGSGQFQRQPRHQKVNGGDQSRHIVVPANAAAKSRPHKNSRLRPRREQKQAVNVRILLARLLQAHGSRARAVSRRVVCTNKQSE